MIYHRSSSLEWQSNLFAALKRILPMKNLIVVVEKIAAIVLYNDVVVILESRTVESIADLSVIFTWTFWTMYSTCRRSVLSRLRLRPRYISIAPKRRERSCSDERDKLLKDSNRWSLYPSPSPSRRKFNWLVRRFTMPLYLDWDDSCSVAIF